MLHGLEPLGHGWRDVLELIDDLTELADRGCTVGLGEDGADSAEITVRW